MDDEVANGAVPMLSTTGRGKQLMELLRKELGVPSGARAFEVRFALNEPVSVKVEYLPRDPQR